MNDAAVERYGHSRDEFLATTIADIRPPEDLERLRRSIAAVRDTVDRAGVWRHLRKDGSPFHVWISS